MLNRLIRFTIICAAFAPLALPQEPAAPARPGERTGARSPLFFSEAWKSVTGEHGATQDMVSNANLELKVYGPAADKVQALGKADDPSNPPHLWTGLCPEPVAITLRDKDNYVDLTGLARIKWVTKVSGFHKIHPVVKLANGTLLVGDEADGSTLDWHENEFSIAEVHWLRLDPNKLVTHGNFVKDPDLSKVDEVGFVDLLPGSGHGPGGWSDLASFEVYGKSVKRDAATSASK